MHKFYIYIYILRHTEGILANLQFGIIIWVGIADQQVFD